MNINCDNKEHLSTYWNLDMPYDYSHKYELDDVGIPTDSLPLIHESTLYPGEEVDVDGENILFIKEDTVLSIIKDD